MPASTLSHSAVGVGPGSRKSAAAAVAAPIRNRLAAMSPPALVEEVSRLEDELSSLEKDAKEARRHADQAERAVESARRGVVRKKEQLAKARAAAG